MAANGCEMRERRWLGKRILGRRRFVCPLSRMGRSYPLLWRYGRTFSSVAGGGPTKWILASSGKEMEACWSLFLVLYFEIVVLAGGMVIIALCIAPAHLK